jgi:hypothetical protein
LSGIGSRLRFTCQAERAARGQQDHAERRVPQSPADRAAGNIRKKLSKTIRFMDFDHEFTCPVILAENFALIILISLIL